MTWQERVKMLEKCCTNRVLSFIQYFLELNKLLFEDKFRFYTTPVQRNKIDMFCERHQTDIFVINYYFRLGKVDCRSFMIMDEKRKTLANYLPKYELEGYPIIYVRKKLIQKLKAMSTDKPDNLFYMYKQEDLELRDAIAISALKKFTKEELDEILKKTNNPDDLIRFSEIYDRVEDGPIKGHDYNSAEGITRLENIQKREYAIMSAQRKLEEEQFQREFKEESVEDQIKRIEECKPIRVDENHRKKVIEMQNAYGDQILLQLVPNYGVNKELLMACFRAGFNVKEILTKLKTN